MIHILVVDDHPAIRQGVQEAFRNTSDILTEEATCVQEAVERVRAGSFSLVLLDLGMPGRGGFELLSDLKGLRPELPILIFSVHDDESYVLRALKQKAAGYLTKGCPAAELIRAVRAVAEGRRYLMAEHAGLLIEQLHRDDRPLHERLSSREHEVMLLLGRGITIRDIARRLGVSESSVSTYRSRILEKLHLENNAQLTRYVLANVR